MNTSELEHLPILRASLDDLAERPAPPSSVDVRAARRSGHRLRRRHTTGRWGSAVALATAAVLCFTLLPSARTGPGDVPGGGTVTTPVDPRTGQPLLALVPGADPYFASATFGWLPTGYTSKNPFEFTGDHGVISGWGPPVPLQGESPSSPFSFVPEITVTFARSPLGAADGSFTGPTESSGVVIDGQTATEQVGPSRTGNFLGSPKSPTEISTFPIELGMLSWRTTDGYFARLTASIPAGTVDAAAVLAHVAQAVKFSAAPIPMPVYLHGIPSTLGSIEEAGPVSPPTNDAWSFTMQLGLDTTDEFYVQVAPTGSPDAFTPFPSQASACKNQKGLRICVFSVNDDPLPAPVAKLGLQGILNEVVGLGADPATWTTDVIR